MTRRAGSKTGRLRAALLGLLDEHEHDGALPTSARFLFYELVQRGVITKTATGARRPDQDMADALTGLREDGQVPWNWIVDETRSVDAIPVAATITAWMTGMLEEARLDPWQGDPAPLVLTESRSLAGVLRATAYQYAVPIASTNGQCGGFLHTQVAPSLAPGQQIIYLGDLDLAGSQIEANTRAVLEQYTGPLRWERLAVTAAQVAEFGLLVITKRDRRYRDGGRLHEAVETEALSQSALTAMLTAHLDGLLPGPLENVLEREDAQRAQLAAWLAAAQQETTDE
jgi:hypothetical protein